MGFFTNRYKELDKDFEEVVPEEKYLRINTLLREEEEVIKRLNRLGVQVYKTALPGCYSYKSSFALSSMTEHLNGWFYLQGLASQAAAYALNPEQGSLVIDMAAAPGSKTTHVSQLMNNTGRIVALDKNRDRLFALRENCERLGVLNVIGVRKDAIYAHDLDLKADYVLLDSPCSGNYCSDEGWEDKRTLMDVQQNARTQRELIKTAYKLLKKGGVLVYSTCSLEPEENELIIQFALSLGFEIEDVNLPDLGQSPGTTSFGDETLDTSLSKTIRFWPYKTRTEGFYIARLKKN